MSPNNSRYTEKAERRMMTIADFKTFEANETHRLWLEFNRKYRQLFPESWVIRIYAKDFRRVEVIPDTGKPLSFVLGLGWDEEVYKAASKCFQEKAQSR